jgi:ubiquinone/menaquinone biosynthesis C-methylase UbiE
MGKDMKTSIEFWKDWWNERASASVADLDIDRGGSHLASGVDGVKQLGELESQAQKQFLAALDPKSDDIVLDAGCGTGANFRILSPLVKKIVGLDFSEAQLRRAEKRVNAEKISNIKLLLGSVAQIPFPDNSFDKVVCTSVLQYLNDDECETTFKEMIRACKNEGTIIIHAKNKTSLYGIALSTLRLIAKVIGRKTVPDYYRPRAWYKKTLAKNGAEIVDFEAFGILHFPPLPESIVQKLLKIEMKHIQSKRLKQFGVNYKMTVKVKKHTHSSQS